jgi:hypothetical protein
MSTSLKSCRIYSTRPRRLWIVPSSSGIGDEVFVAFRCGNPLLIRQAQAGDGGNHENEACWNMLRAWDPGWRSVGFGPRRPRHNSDMILVGVGSSGTS